MKTLVITLAAIVALGILAPAAMAVVDPFVMTYTGSVSEWVYKLTNNHATIDVYDFSLHWNPTDWEDDAIQAGNNFNPVTGYKGNPAGWEVVDGPNPWLGTYTGSGGPGPNPIIHGTSVPDGFKLTYKPNATHPGWFRVSYFQGSDHYYYDMIKITPIPEPAGIAALLSGLVGSGMLFRKRNR